MADATPEVAATANPAPANPLAPIESEAVAAAKVIGAQAISDARDAAHTILNHLATSLIGELPKFDDAALATLYDFVPEAERGAAQMMVGAMATQTVDRAITPALIAVAQRGLGTALHVIDSVLK